MEGKDSGVLDELLQIKREIASEYKTFHDYFVDLLKYQKEPANEHTTSFLPRRGCGCETTARQGR